MDEMKLDRPRQAVMREWSLARGCFYSVSETEW